MLLDSMTRKCLHVKFWLNTTQYDDRDAWISFNLFGNYNFVARIYPLVESQIIPTYIYELYTVPPLTVL